MVSRMPQIKPTMPCKLRLHARRYESTLTTILAHAIYYRNSKSFLRRSSIDEQLGKKNYPSKSEGFSLEEERSMKKEFCPGNKQDTTKLNVKQQAFVDFYIQTNGNLSESVRRAGYSSKNASAMGIELLKNSKIQSAIDARLKQLESERIAKDREVLEYITSVMRGETTEEIVVNVGKGKGFTKPERVIAQVSAKERLKAAEMLAKVKGMFITKQEVELNGVVPVVLCDDF